MIMGFSEEMIQDVCGKGIIVPNINVKFW